MSVVIRLSDYFGFTDTQLKIENVDEVNWPP